MTPFRYHRLSSTTRWATHATRQGCTLVGMSEPSRILDIPENEYSPEQKQAIDALLQGRGRLLMPYRVWIHSPYLAQAMERLGTFLNKQSSLSQREVELAIVLAARHW